MSETELTDANKKAEDEEGIVKNEADEPVVNPPLKSILKRERNHPNKKVDFNLQVKCIPFDPSKDYTVEIKIVDKIVHIKSWAAIMEQRRREAEEAAKAITMDSTKNKSGTTDDDDDDEEIESLSTSLSKRVLQRQASPTRGKKKATKSPEHQKNGVNTKNTSTVIAVDS